MINLFTGFDQREAAGWHAFVQSVIATCSQPVSVTPLVSDCVMPQGTNAFTFARFLIPELMNWQGYAIFVDGADMLCRADLAELEALRDYSMAVQVVKHQYLTKNPRKYIGTSMECVNRNYERKNWASVMLINCAHPAWRNISKQTINALQPLDLMELRFIDESRIGYLPPEWNWLADEFGSYDGAKLLHWTAGIPGFYHYRTAPHANEWFESGRMANGLG